MRELRFSAADVAMTRFAFSPLWELIASVRLLKTPHEHVGHQSWRDWAHERIAASGRDFGLLSALVPTSVIPAFVAPPPRVTAPEFADELAALRSVPPEVVRANLNLLPNPWAPRIADLYEDPRSGLAQLADTLAEYWELVLAPWWPRIRVLCEADVTHRARQLATGGAQALFDELHPSMSWHTDRLRIRLPRCEGQSALGGRGLLLTPSVFVPRLFTLTTGDWQPTLRYPPRGMVNLWSRAVSPPDEGLAGVLGRTRAQLLSGLSAPASTGELALRTGITPGGVSQHLGALHVAGLVQKYRSGRFVLYARTTTGERLVAGAAD